MSTYGNSLYRPIKMVDIESIGFEKEIIQDRVAIKISKDKIKLYVDHQNRFRDLIGSDISNVPDFYYLYLDQQEMIKDKECYWCFTRYNINSPALDYFLESLTDLGYKFKVEGERFNKESNILMRKNLEKYMKNNLVVTED